MARTLLADPDRWTKGALWRDERGEALHTGELLQPPPSKMCLVGALISADPGPRSPGYVRALDVLSALIYPVYPALPTFNDTPGTRHKDVLDLLDWGVGLLEAEVTTAPARRAKPKRGSASRASSRARVASKG